ncbi:kinase-like domain-containing protein [Gigaspora rosea]|uniref:Kinase-like domain-containing protein n=1 Tax=Gigaspora rosea TaxID=44941 RepID=A0A397VUY8_9GLOM|nr:kinase-like domain-containing protein [Gigaspora rosea]
MFENQQEQIDSSSDIIQLAHNVTQLHLENDKSNDFVNEIIEEMLNKEQNPVNIINFCLNDQVNPIIQIVLASCYYYGKWVEKDEHKAFIYYQKSAEMGNANATFKVGNCYSHGIGVEKDEHKAFIYYQKSAEMGDADGTFKVGYCYDYGIGVEKDEHKAFIYYQKSAEMGNANGTFNVGYCYHHGIGVEKDEHKAFIYYQKSAEMGDASGTYFVGYCYFYGIGVEKDEHKAFIYYQKSAEMGDTDGTFNVGSCYRHGIGVEKDEHKAFVYYSKSAELGNASGMSSVAECYRNGIGIRRDLNKAKYWYQRLIEIKNITATNEWIHNSEIEDDLKKALTKDKYQLSWISYDEFKDIKEIGRGGFATVFYASWFDKSQNLTRSVALKLLHKSNRHHEEFIRELKAFCDISLKDPTFLKCFGISKDITSKDYILVLDYASKGCLRNNLLTVAQMDWKDKLNLLQCIASDLHIIHSHDLIHCDLHSGNILQNSFKSAYIADLGLSITANIALKSKSDKICGILPYIAPEVLNKHSYTKASNIYSFGIIMWEILYSKPVSYEQKSKLQSKLQFQIQVCNGLRSHIYDDTAKCYADLMKKCWNLEPNERPTAAKICDIFAEWENNEIILSELSDSDKKLLGVKNDYIHEFIDSNYKNSEIYELEIPDTVDE